MSDSAGTIDVWGITHVGRVREVNEDHFFVASLEKFLRVLGSNLDDLKQFDSAKESRAFLFVVADGVGTVGGGRLASGTAVRALVTYIGRTMGWYYSSDVDSEHEFIGQLENAVQHTHETVLREFSSKGRGPATTLTMATLIWPRAYVVHVGDSRAYHLHRGLLRQITRDQTMGELMIDQGIMTKEQVSRSSLSNTLSSAVGAEIKPSVELVDLQWGDTLLLCTDGLTKHVPDDQITELLRGAGNAEVACHRLVDAALDGGGRDNITVVVGRAAVGDERMTKTPQNSPAN